MANFNDIKITFTRRNMTTFSAIGFIHFVNDPVHRKRCHVYPRMKTLGVVGVGVVLHRQDEGDGVIEFAISL